MPSVFYFLLLLYVALLVSRDSSVHGRSIATLRRPDRADEGPGTLEPGTRTHGVLSAIAREGANRGENAHAINILHHEDVLPIVHVAARDVVLIHIRKRQAAQIMPAVDSLDDLVPSRDDQGDTQSDSSGEEGEEDVSHSEDDDQGEGSAAQGGTAGLVHGVAADIRALQQPTTVAPHRLVSTNSPVTAMRDKQVDVVPMVTNAPQEPEDTVAPEDQSGQQGGTTSFTLLPTMMSTTEPDKDKLGEGKLPSYSPPTDTSGVTTVTYELLSTDGGNILTGLSTTTSLAQPQVTSDSVMVKSPTETHPPTSTSTLQSATPPSYDLDKFGTPSTSASPFAHGHTISATDFGNDVTERGKITASPTVVTMKVDIDKDCLPHEEPCPTKSDLLDLGANLTEPYPTISTDPDLVDKDRPPRWEDIPSLR